ncbi:hypothetical protein [Streptomyces mutabilis]|uniref:hypothetical protein n=1 Tax=Streptomyces mutabilis TaxID=67332 RepID=UPI001F2CC14F|nr:hypothetical protein [Streptomyces mutabilis]
MFVQRHGDIVEWSDWQVPVGEARPRAFHFDAGQYDAEVVRVSAHRGRQADAGS